MFTASRDANRLSNEINRQSSIIHDELVNFFSSFFVDRVDGRPQRCESSHDDLPRLNLAYHFVTVEYAGADSLMSPSYQ